MKNNLENKKLIIIFFIAFSLRFAIFLAVEPWEDAVLQDRILISDAKGYHRIAVNLLENNVFSKEEYAPFRPDISRPPVYPTFLAIIFGIFGNKPYLAILIQLAIDSLTCIFTYKLGKNLFGEKIGLLAALLFGLEYFSILHCNRLFADTLFTFLFIIHIHFLSKYFIIKNLKYLIFSAIFLGISTLCKPVATYFVIFLLVVFFVQYKNFLRKGIMRYIIYATAFIITITPWALRNYIVAGKFLVSSHQIEVLNWNLYYLDQFKKDQMQDHAGFQKAPENTSKSELENKIYALLLYAKKYSAGIIQFFTVIGSNAYTSLLGMPTGAEVEREEWDRGLFNVFKFVLKQKSGLEIMIILWGLTYLIALYFSICYGIFTFLAENKLKKIILFIIIIFYFVIASAGIAYTPRYRMPIMPYMLIIACYGITRIQRRFHY
jgi:4-amino-4-deoxy-L-arabinose transferase-like glycosyltransferase